MREGEQRPNRPKGDPVDQEPKPPEPTFFLGPATYICPKHGRVTNYITIPGHGGLWCCSCWVEMLEGAGVCQVERRQAI